MTISSSFRNFGLFTFLLFVATNLNAQQAISLYGGAIPGAKPTPASYVEETITREDKVVRTSKVSKPELYVYQPASPTGTAVIICPGGGYGILAIDKEGHDVAKKFQEMGVTAFVLKYRLPSDLIMKDKSLGPLQDALQAIYLVRKNAALWGIDPNKVGIMGFSAGGHLASTASTHFSDMKIDNQENISLRPSFSILIYPVITFGTNTHAGSVKNLLGETPTDEQKNIFLRNDK